MVLGQFGADCSLSLILLTLLLLLPLPVLLVPPLLPLLLLLMRVLMLMQVLLVADNVAVNVSDPPEFSAVVVALVVSVTVGAVSLSVIVIV